MTHPRDRKLDSILNGLLYVDKMRLNNEPVNKKITIEFICENLSLDCELWEMKHLKNELISDNLIIEHSGELSITDKGKKFVTREKGYSEKADSKQDEFIIRKNQIEKFKYDKYSFWISVTAIIISLISLLWTINE